jgi:hypothetical protein
MVILLNDRIFSLNVLSLFLFQLEGMNKERLEVFYMEKYISRK